MSENERMNELLKLGRQIVDKHDLAIEGGVQ